MRSVLLSVLLGASAGVVAQWVDGTALARFEAAFARAETLYASGRPAEALGPAEEAVSAGRSFLVDAQSGALAETLALLGVIRWDLGDLLGAEGAFREALHVRRSQLGPDHRLVASDLSNLGLLLIETGRNDEARLALQQGLAVARGGVGGAADAAPLLDNLARLALLEAKYRDAEQHYREALRVLEAEGAAHSATYLSALDGLGTTLQRSSRLDDAQATHERALALGIELHGEDHPSVVALRSGLASTMLAQGRSDVAVQLYRQVLAAPPAARGGSERDEATHLANLATALAAAGEQLSAIGLYDRALRLHRHSGSTSGTAYRAALSGRGLVRLAAGDAPGAREDLDRVLSIARVVDGARHPRVAHALNNLGLVEMRLARPDLAIERYAAAVAILEGHYGATHPSLASPLHNAAAAAASAGLTAQAEQLYTRALELRERWVGPTHPGTLDTLEQMARLYAASGDRARALAFARRASAAYERSRTRVGYVASARDHVERRKRREHLQFHAEQALERGADDEAFRLAELARDSVAGEALIRTAARFAAGSGALSALVREREAALHAWVADERALLRVLADQDAEKAAAELTGRLEASEREAERLDAELRVQFPAYADLVRPEPPSIAEVQRVLRPGEALLAFAVGPERTVAWLVRGADARGVLLAAGEPLLTDAVEDVRSTVEPDGGPIEPFATQVSARLHRTLIAPFGSELGGVSHLIVVPDGPLASLPFALLSETAPADASARTSDYRRIPWLLRRHALTTAPSVASLVALRERYRRSGAPEPLIGFGDPDFSGEGRTAPTMRVAFARGGLADLHAVRGAPPLPETAAELARLAESVGAGAASLFLGSRANERMVKSLPLERYRIVAFATHAVVSGDLRGLHEPGLLLSPPEHATVDDDGVLTASEVARLRLDAELVVLSACNTAAPGGNVGGEGLSGLARAFFYAGARSMLVSHWAVETHSASALTTRLLDVASTQAEAGWAGAMRRASLDLLDAVDARWSHPIFWAPFVVVGEGGQR